MDQMQSTNNSSVLFYCINSPADEST